MSSRDFQASQIRLNKIIASGSDSSEPQIIIYSASAARNYAGWMADDVLSNVGTDVFLFVSGSANDRTSVSLFGGDLVVSGTLYAERMIVEIEESTTGSLSVSGSLFVSQSITVNEGLTVNLSRESGTENNFVVAGPGGTNILDVIGNNVNINSSQNGGNFKLSSDNKSQIIQSWTADDILILGGADGAGIFADGAMPSDTNVYVTGTIGSKDSSARGTSVFGGDVVISGTLHTDIINSTGSNGISFQLAGVEKAKINLSGRVESGGGIGHLGDTNTGLFFGVTDSFYLDAGGKTALSALENGSNDRIWLGSYGVQGSGESYKFDQVMILSGGAPGSIDESAGADVMFYVSGSTGNKNSAVHRGTSVFGGDVVISGSLTDGSGNPIAGSGGGGDSIGWFSGSSATHGDLGIQPSWISTSGSLAVSGSLEVAERIYHQGDTDTSIGFFTDQLTMMAGGKGIVAGLSSGIALLGSAGTEAQKFDQVLIMSGGAAASANEAAGSDVSFYVSGSTGNKNSVTHRGTSVFGGDVVISGSLTDGDGNPIAGAGGGSGDTVGWFAGSAGNLAGGGEGAGWISATGSLAISGSELMIATSIGHIGDPGTEINFGTENIELSVSGYSALVVDHSPSNTAPHTTFNLEGENFDFGVVGNDGYAKIYLSGTSATTQNLYLSASQVLIGTGSSAVVGTDTVFFVSGATGFKDSGAKGVALFGGDLVVSGVIYGGYDEDTAAPFLELNADTTVISSKAGSENVETGTDTIFFVSGAEGSKGTANRGTTVLGGDVVVSGSLYGGPELIISSDVRLDAANGSTQYLNFGESNGDPGYGIRTNAGIVELRNHSGSWGQVVSSGSGVGYVTVSSGSTTVANTTTLNLDMLGSVMDLGSGVTAITGTIGASNAVSYSDGLFATFDTTTPVGHAINKLNEVLKYLSPTPAPDLDNIDSNHTGIGARHTINGVTGMASAASGIGNQAGVANNSFYQVTTSSGDIRAGIFNHTTTIEGDLNSDISSVAYSNGVLNHSGSVFGDANIGSLALWINGTSIVSVDLTSNVGGGEPGFGSATIFGSGDNSTSGFINFSQTGSAVQANGQDFGLFQNRTGKFRVHPSAQRDGLNYAQVIHTVGSTTKTTNYIEWLVDPSGSNNITVTNARLPDEATISLGGSVWVSGIQYATSATGNYLADISNYYEHVFTNETITFGTTNCTIPTQTVPTGSGGASSYSEIVGVTGSFGTDGGFIPGSTISVNLSVPHVLKSSVSNAGSITSSPFLIYSSSWGGTTLVEDFNRESGRVVSASYDAMADVPGGGSPHANMWNMTASLAAAGDGHDGLQIFNGTLVSPLNTITGLTTPGDFRSVNNSGANFGDGYSLDGNPNYSSITGTRTFYRAFTNGTGADARDFDVTITGGGATTIVPLATALNSGRIKVQAKIPGKTGFLDLGSLYAYNTGSDGAGGRIGSLDATVDSGGSVNHFTFGTGSIANTDRIVLKIEADATWTGNIDNITVNFPAVNVTEVTEAPDIDDISCSDSGVTGKLSFGASNTIGGYNNVTGSATSLPNVDWNGIYTITSAGDDLRRGIFDGTSDINGTVNDTTAAATPNEYSANSFGNAITGTLSLEVNGATLKTIALYDFGLGTVDNTNKTGSNGSGFINISSAMTGADSNNLPDYRRWYRTADWNVDTLDQQTGSNYARVVHTRSLGNIVTTNYVEWVNDTDSNTITIDDAEFFPNFVDDEYYYQSGVKYFASSPTSYFNYRVTNGYTNVYSSNSSALYIDSISNFTVTRMDVTGSGLTNSGSNSTTIAYPVLVAGAGSPQTLPIFVTSSITFSQSKSLPGIWGDSAYGVTGSANAMHPLDSNAASASIKKSPLLVFSASLTNNSAQTSNINTEEVFAREDYRMLSGSFTTQSATGSAGWNSSTSIEGGGAGYDTGLIIYNYKVGSPLSSNLPASGDFRDTSESGTYTTPLSNVNYSTLSNATRDYYRPFVNNTTSDQADVSIVIYGDATLTPRSGAGSGTLGANKNFFADVKIPGKTGWLDTAKAANGGVSDGDGALSGDRDSVVDGVGATNIADFQTQFVAGTVSSGGPEHFIIRIVADKTWTGHISRIVVSYV